MPARDINQEHKAIGEVRMDAGELTDAVKGFRVPFWVHLRLSNLWVQFGIILFYDLQFLIFIFLFDRFEVAIQNGALYWHIWISLMIVFCAFLGKQLHNGITNFYGIDPTQPKNSEHPASLKLLFREDFSAFQKDFKEKLFWRGHNILALAILACIAALLVPPAVIELLEGKQRELWGIEMNPFVFFYSFVGWCLYAFLILEWVSAFTSLFAIVRSFSKLGSNPGINILQVSILKKERKCLKESPLSLKEFKDRCKEITKFLFKFSFCIFIILIGLGVFVYLVFQYAELKAAGSITFILSGFVPIILLFTVISLLLFFLPQWSLNKLIKTKRTELVGFLEEEYEDKKLEWLLLPILTADSKRQRLWEDFNALSLIINDLKNLKAWLLDIKLILPVLVMLFVDVAWNLFTEKTLEFLGII
ncbi:MAG: hypothetical protein ACXAB4_11185 [Candidatus Hodarchaeales archaeon]